MFAAFIVQIVFRYVLNFPIGWTSELTRHHVALAGALRRRLRRHREAKRSASISSTARSAAAARLVTMLVTGIFLIAMYVHLAAGGPRLRALHEGAEDRLPRYPLRRALLIYPVFAVAVIVRYAWLLWNALRGKAPEAFDPTKASSGV